MAALQRIQHVMPHLARGEVTGLAVVSGNQHCRAWLYWHPSPSPLPHGRPGWRWLLGGPSPVLITILPPSLIGTLPHLFGWRWLLGAHVQFRPVFRHIHCDVFDFCGIWNMSGGLLCLYQGGKFSNHLFRIYRPLI